MELYPEFYGIDYGLLMILTLVLTFVFSYVWIVKGGVGWALVYMGFAAATFLLALYVLVLGLQMGWDFPSALDIVIALGIIIMILIEAIGMEVGHRFCDCKCGK